MHPPGLVARASLSLANDQGVPDYHDGGGSVVFEAPAGYLAARARQEESDRSAVPYAADQSGSVIGLVTFGDEPVASVTVVPDRADIAEPSLQAWTERMPPEGTPVTVLIRRFTPRAP